MTDPTLALACNPLALTVVQRQEFDSVTQSLLAEVQETRELENGFLLRFANEPDRLNQIAGFIERESLCCPFLNFALEVQPQRGPIWLRLTGPDGTKEFLKAEVGFA
jgi:hypothetical protein